MDLIVGISYSDSIDKGFEVLRKIVAVDPRFLKEPAPQFMVQTLADSSVNLQLRAWATGDDYWNLVWAHNKIIKEEIEAAGLSIPFPQRDVRVIEEKQDALLPTEGNNFLREFTLFIPEKRAETKRPRGKREGGSAVITC